MQPEELVQLMQAAQAGDLAAFEKVMRSYQSMAYGYAYSLLRDSHWAEDVAQEAFIEAYRNLPKLREPAAFPGWLRKIVFKHCDRLTRKKRPSTVSFDVGWDMPGTEAGPGEHAEREETRQRVMAAIDSLPENERTVMMLFYVSEYSHSEITEFLNIPISKVKNRLHSARRRLMEGMFDMAREALADHISVDRFSREVIEKLLSRPRLLEIDGNPLRETYALVRSALANFEEVAAPEVLPKRDIVSELDSRIRKKAFHLDEENILRTHLTDAVMKSLMDRPLPVQVLAGGRAFESDAEKNHITHEVVASRVGPDADEEDAQRRMLHVVEQVLGPVESRLVPYKFHFLSQGHHLEVYAEDRHWLVAGYGMIKERHMRDLRHDPEAVSGWLLGVSLEHLAMLRYKIDNAASFWQAPYCTSI